MKNEILVLTEEMTKLIARIEADLTSTLVNLSGSLKGIECGTHIKIPTAVGYASYYKSQEGTENLTLYLKDILRKPDEYQEYLDDITDEINSAKSE